MVGVLYNEYCPMVSNGITLKISNSNKHLGFLFELILYDVL